MGVYDRDWMRENQVRRNEPVIVRALIGINVVVFLLGYINANTWGAFFYDYGTYNAYDTFVRGWFWQPITYQFLHADFGHIFLNMLCLWVFGGAVEQSFGHNKFLGFYLVCGVASALFSSLLAYLGVYSSYGQAWYDIGMVGASGSIFGVIAASAVLFPKARIMLIFPLPIEMYVRTFALVVLGIAVAFIVFDWTNAGGQAGHLGGMFMGFFLMWTSRMLQKIRNL